jgi:hypothetical protein
MLPFRDDQVREDGRLTRFPAETFGLLPSIEAPA